MTEMVKMANINICMSDLLADQEVHRLSKHDAFNILLGAVLLAGDGD